MTAAEGISGQQSAVLQLDFWEGGVVAVVEWEGASKEDPHSCALDAAVS